MADINHGNLTAHKRFWEIDLLRTLAIIRMIHSHVLYILSYFDIHTGLLHGWVFGIGGRIFIFLAGVSLTIAYSRGKTMSGSLFRGLKIFGWGMLITLLTWLIVPEEYVRFGILHFFGIAFILAPFFLRFRYTNLIVGAVLMVLGTYLQEQGVFPGFPWLLWLIPYSHATFDYWPLVPWFGLFLLGMFAGKMLYPQGNRRFNIPDFSHPVVSALTLPGRHPLVIYLAHFPILIGVIFAIYPDKILPYIKEALSYLPF
jgi:uncharacterized membrane protein